MTQQNIPARQRQGQLTKEQLDTLSEIAQQEGIPVTGITLLGGKPYINVTGLDVKLKNLCEREKLVLLGVEYIPFDVKPTQDGKYRAGGMGIVRLFDKEGFQRAVELLAKGKEPITREILDSLKDLYVRTFKMNGWASSQTLQMSTMQNVDNIEMMAARRATNRAKREATGTGLTSIDEIDEDSIAAEQSQDEEAKERVRMLLEKPKPEDVERMFSAFQTRLGVPKQVVLRKLGVSSETDITRKQVEEMAQVYRDIDGGERTKREVFGDLLESVSRETEQQTTTKSVTQVVDSVKLYNDIAAKIRTAKSAASLDRIVGQISDAFAMDYLKTNDAQELSALAEERRQLVNRGEV